MIITRTQKLHQANACLRGIDKYSYLIDLQTIICLSFLNLRTVSMKHIHYLIHVLLIHIQKTRSIITPSKLFILYASSALRTIDIKDSCIINLTVTKQALYLNGDFTKLTAKLPHQAHIAQINCIRTIM